MFYALVPLRPKIKDISLEADLIYYEVMMQACNKSQVRWIFTFPERLGRTSIKVILLLPMAHLLVDTG